MPVQQERNVDVDQLTNADEQILDELHGGARTKKALVDATGLHRNTVGNRLDVLEAGDAVRCIHETTALYELADDPRADPTDSPDEARRLRAAVDDLQAERDALEQDLAAARERIDRLEGQARQADIDIDRALDELPDDAPGRLAVEDAREMLREGR